MSFADPQSCPVCRGSIRGVPRCPQCGFDLTTPEARQLWQMLLEADAQLARAVTASRPVAPPPPPPPAPAPQPAAPPPPAAAPQPAYPPHQPYPPAAPRTAPAERSWSVGTIVLALGALCLVVAGFIFITRSWDTMGLVGRTLVLTGVTAVIGALGVWVTRRPLRASAEAVWSVFLGLLTLDFFAARHEGLLGLGALSPAWATMVWGVALLGLGIALTMWAKRFVDAQLVATSVAAAVGIALAGSGAMAAPEEWDVFWRAFLALVVVGVLALAVRPLSLAVVTITGRVVVAVFFAIAFVAALVELFANPSLDELVNDGHGLPMVLMIVASLAIGAAIAPLRTPAAALAVGGLTALVLTPAGEVDWPQGLWLGIAALSVVLTWAAWTGTDAWRRGVRLGSLVPVTGLGIVMLACFAITLAGVGDLMDRSGQGTASMRAHVADRVDIEIWAMLLVAAAVPVVVGVLFSWPELDRWREHRRGAVLLAAGVALALAIVPLDLPLWAACAVPLVAGGLALAARDGVTRDLTVGVLLVLASFLAFGSDEVAAIVWLAAGVNFALLSVTSDERIARGIAAVSSVGLLASAAVAAGSALDVRDAVTALVVTALGLVVVAVSQLVPQLGDRRIPIEAAGGLVVLCAVCAGGSAGEASLRWTLAGVVLIALSFVVRDRRWYIWPGGVALLVAYVLLIVDSGFDFVEAYTLPLGAAALVTGFLVHRRKPDLSSWVVAGPGLALTLLPSVPQALAEPTGLRALLLGGGAVVALALGLQWRWQAPFVFGAVIVGLLVVVNIGPYANAMPRTLLIAVVGAVLLGLGITWEDRVRDGRQLARFVRSMS